MGLLYSGGVIVDFINWKFGLSQQECFEIEWPGGFAYIITKRSVRLGADVCSSLYVQ